MAAADNRTAIRAVIQTVTALEETVDDLRRFLFVLLVWNTLLTLVLVIHLSLRIVASGGAG